MTVPFWDKISKLRLANEDLEQAKFKITKNLKRIAVRVANDEDDPLWTIPLSLIENIKVYNIDAPDGNYDTEYIHNFTNKTKGFQIRVRKTDKMRISFLPNGTFNNQYLRYNKGTLFKQDGMRLIGSSVYISLDKGNNTIEIVEYL